ncbi:hypothetical protein FACS189426_18410 [Bacteroidia bacterium]|nr:hypothetical protein FACS189426_18390 [Bacteroidia bacterium]GHT13460.1 hypothetical protein FACS189426_18410 [Bacteroidia bacterium]
MVLQYLYKGKLLNFSKLLSYIGKNGKTDPIKTVEIEPLILLKYIIADNEQLKNLFVNTIFFTTWYILLNSFIFVNVLNK